MSPIKKVLGAGADVNPVSLEEISQITHSPDRLLPHKKTGVHICGAVAGC